MTIWEFHLVFPNLEELIVYYGESATHDTDVGVSFGLEGWWEVCFVILKCLGCFVQI